MRRQGSQVSMRVARGIASWLLSHGRGLGPRDAHLEHACTETETKSEDIGQSNYYITLTTTPRDSYLFYFHFIGEESEI